MVATDWKDAGIALVDEDGRRADFHSLRKTLCTMMQESGVPQRIAQEIMRHSDPRLTTQVYTDTKQFNLRNVLDSLPKVINNEKCPPICPPNLVQSRHQLSLLDTSKEDFQKVQVVVDEQNCHYLSLSDMENKNGGSGRTRTCDLEIMSHPL